MSTSVDTLIACDGTDSSTEMVGHPEGLGYLLNSAAGTLVEDPNDPGHFKGTTLVLDQVSQETGGSSELKIVGEWDLRRRLTQ